MLTPYKPPRNDSGVKRQRTTPSARFRSSSSSRGYDGTWAKVADAHRQQHPFCARCNRLVGLKPYDYAIDHITPLDAGGERLDPSNLQTLCRSCHNIKTARDKAK